VSAVDCRTLHGLLGRWYDGDLPPEDAEGFEEHLVLCPPCLVENRRLRVALAALAGAAELLDESGR
jgi:hypothetical protein